MNKLLELYNKYKMPILYLFFGGLTTLLNIIIYYLCAYILSLSTAISTIIAWFLALIFAFITNRIYVFESTSKSILTEFFTFFLCRLSTGILDLILMCVTVDLLHFNDLIMKILSNIIVIILNFILSKLIVFKNGD